MSDLKATNNLPSGSHNIAINSYSSTGGNVKIVQMVPNMHSNSTNINMIIPNAASPSYNNTHPQFSAGGDSMAQLSNQSSQMIFQKKISHEHSVATSSSGMHQQANNASKNVHNNSGEEVMSTQGTHRYIHQSSQPIFRPSGPPLQERRTGRDPNNSQQQQPTYLTYTPQQNSQNLIPGQIVHHIQSQQQQSSMQSPPQQQTMQQHIRQHSQTELLTGMSSGVNTQIVGQPNSSQNISHSIQQTLSNQNHAYPQLQQKTATRNQHKNQGTSKAQQQIIHRQESVHNIPQQHTQHAGHQDLSSQNNNSSHNQMHSYPPIPTSHVVTQRGINQHHIVQQNQQHNSNSSQQQYVSNRLSSSNNGDCGVASPHASMKQHNITVQQHTTNPNNQQHHQILLDQHNNIYQPSPASQHPNQIIQHQPSQQQLSQQQLSQQQQITSVNSNYLQSQQQRIYIPQQSQHQFIAVASSGAPPQQIQIHQPQQLQQQQIQVVAAPIQQLQQQATQPQQYIGSQQFYTNTILNSGSLPSCSASENLSAKETYRDLKRKFEYLVYENEYYQEKLRNSQRELLKLSRDKNYLLDRLLNYENVSESSDDSDASAKTLEDRNPKSRKNVNSKPMASRKKPSTSVASSSGISITSCSNSATLAPPQTLALQKKSTTSIPASKIKTTSESKSFSNIDSYNVTLNNNEFRNESASTTGSTNSRNNGFSDSSSVNSGENSSTPVFVGAPPQSNGRMLQQQFGNQQQISSLTNKNRNNSGLSENSPSNDTTGNSRSSANHNVSNSSNSMQFS